jgi:hypothetical protein
MEDDATRTTSPRSKSARPPAALFVEPKVPAARPAPDPEPEPDDDADPVPEPVPESEPVPEPEPVARRDNGTRPKAAAPEKAPVRRPAAKKATARKKTPVVPLWWTRTPTRLAAVPTYLAETAVERYGDSAHRYVQWLRDTYPDATPDGLARAVMRHTIGYPLLSGPAGVLATQARLVLHIAAAYGRDPRDAARVPDLLELVTPKGLAGPLLARMSGRLLPGAGLVAGALTDSGVLERTAHRAIAYYTART